MATPDRATPTSDHDLPLPPILPPPRELISVALGRCWWTWRHDRLAAPPAGIGAAGESVRDSARREPDNAQAGWPVPGVGVKLESCRRIELTGGRRRGRGRRHDAEDRRGARPRPPAGLLAALGRRQAHPGASLAGPAGDPGASRPPPPRGRGMREQGPRHRSMTTPAIKSGSTRWCGL
jgi:hypothetical protein